MNPIMILLIIFIIPMFILMTFTPYWTRKTESFGISIPMHVFYEPTLKQMRKQYAWILSAVSMLVAVLLLILGSIFDSETEIGILFGCITAGFFTISFIIYLKFHIKMKQMKQQENWYENRKQQVVVSTTFHQQKRTFSNLWFIVSFFLTFITVILTLRFYDRIPDPIPIQYNLSGNVTNWAKKTYRSTLFLPLMQVYLTLIFIFVNTIIAKAKQQISAENPEASLKQNIRFRRKWSLFIILMGISLTMMFSLFQVNYFLDMPNQLMTLFPFVLTGVILIAALVLSIQTGQGGSRINVAGTSDGQHIDRDDDQYWKLGQFYFNKDDPALFLEKRFGVGWTINLGRPAAWLSLLGIIALAIFIPFLLI